jgi:hypothetical protein
MTGYEWWWSWLLTLPQLYAQWNVGNRHRWAWLLAFTIDVLWVIYSLLTRQYGFLISATLFGALALRNWSKWGQIDAASAANRPMSPSG